MGTRLLGPKSSRGVENFGEANLDRSIIVHSKLEEGRRSSYKFSTADARSTSRKTWKNTTSTSLVKGSNL